LARRYARSYFADFQRRFNENVVTPGPSTIHTQLAAPVLDSPYKNSIAVN
jgi:hypothetical protein